jgi:hypothetical protein
MTYSLETIIWGAPLLGAERALLLVQGQDRGLGGHPRVPPAWGVADGVVSLPGEEDEPLLDPGANSKGLLGSRAPVLSCST